ncbi:hypothetical protein Nepgr_016046 [Nepenthes gracilis]|uniref:Uncharacterized protein n=1 Tax=Nepenthes gracilis TaxID=150966 RepID=A0AAD3XS61_NEPGR|nr:hypothetical protein Nepgr_016046 [Nepenthes gracilis]
MSQEPAESVITPSLKASFNANIIPWRNHSPCLSCRWNPKKVLLFFKEQLEKNYNFNGDGNASKRNLSQGTAELLEVPF